MLERNWPFGTTYYISNLQINTVLIPHRKPQTSTHLLRKLKNHLLAISLCTPTTPCHRTEWVWGISEMEVYWNVYFTTSLRQWCGITFFFSIIFVSAWRCMSPHSVSWHQLFKYCCSNSNILVYQQPPCMKHNGNHFDNVGCTTLHSTFQLGS